MLKRVVIPSDYNAKHALLQWREPQRKLCDCSYEYFGQPHLWSIVVCGRLNCIVKHVYINKKQNYGVKKSSVKNSK
jgi:hypothetical protein